MIKTAKKLRLRIGVLMGGRSIEREVSFNSGRTICDHLDTQRFDIIPIFQKDNGQLYLLPWHFLHRGKITDFYDRLDLEAKKIDWDDLKLLIDFVYLALHGRWGEDGTVQGFLDILDIPYLGAKTFGSALIMDKIAQKNILKANGISVANNIILFAHEIKNINTDQYTNKVLQKLKKTKIDFPCVVKPSNEGSSFGVTVVKNIKELIGAVKKASSCTPGMVQDVLIEEKLVGMEFVSVVLQKSKDKWLPCSVTEVITEQGSNFYDYEQKYMPGRATKITPARCSQKDYKKITDICLKVTKLLNFSAISRIDGFFAKDGTVYIIDPNSLTGMSPSSFLFHQAAEIGMNHTQLINYLIDTELRNYGINQIEKKSNMKKENINKTRVVVLLGGQTNEREISLESGRNICYKLSPHKYDVIPVFVNDKNELYKLTTRLLVQNSTREIMDNITNNLKIKWSDLPSICDFVFIGLHGGAGEGGQVQGALEMLGLPYNGSGVLTSGLCMDKYRTARFLKQKGFDVPNSILLEKKETKEENLLEKIKEFNFPLILKPHDDGCSFFVEKVNNKDEFLEKLKSYFKNSKKDIALVEEFISGIELTCGVFGNYKGTALPPSQVMATRDILSIQEKFLPGAGQNLTPAPLPKDAIKFIQNEIEKSYQALNCKGYARIDCFYQDAKYSSTKKQRLVLLEVNTLPGMTPATCIFHQAAEIGLRPMEFIDKIVELGLELHKKVVVQKSNIKQPSV